ncbi:MAG: hypothetical protein LUG21_02835 [Clostridiales bacterium]|nr:hypothetical protein [Clostridiales bacterium]
MFIHSKSFSAVNNPFYIYRKGVGSSVTASQCKKITDGICVTVKKWSEKSKYIENDILRKDILDYSAYMYSTSVVLLGRIKGKDKKEAIKELKKYKYILKYGTNKKTKAVRACVSILGFTVSSAIAGLIKR